MWSPSPTVFSLLTDYINRMTPRHAAEYPAVHFALLHSLYQECLRWDIPLS